VQWEVLLDGEFRAVPGDRPPPAAPGGGLALRHLFLPVRY
jgi:hypothetical protein